MLISQEDFKAVVPISQGFTFDKLNPFIRRAELKFIKPILGADLYSALVTAYDGGDGSLSEAQANLMEYVHPALANLVIWMGIPQLNIQMDDTGLQSHHSESYKPAFEWQVEDARESFLSNGFDALDEIISYLESVAEDDFPDWLNSEGCTLVREFFINTSPDFTYFIGALGDSRFLFRKMQPIMRRMERNYIRGTIGKELFAQMKLEIKTDELTEENEALLEDIQGAVAHYTWASALNELAVQTDPVGIHLRNNTFSGTTRAKQAAEMERLAAIRMNHEQAGREYLEAVHKALYENIDDYPLFENSTVYVSTGPVTTYENDADSGIVSLD